MMMTTTRLVALSLGLALATTVLASTGPQSDETQRHAAAHDTTEHQQESAMLKVYFLEIVTPAVEETCNALAKAHGVTFSAPVPEFGNSRTADLHGGGRLSVRAPMRDTENPIVRPYLLVEDIQASVDAVKEAGATIALPPMEIPGQGTFSIYILGGIEHGFWQVPATP